MRSYTCNVTIEYCIERIKDSQTNKYRIVTDEDPNEQIEELLLEISGRYHFSPGQYYGPPEHCYEDESELEITSIIYNNKPFECDFTEKEINHIEEKLIDAIQE